MKQTAYRKDIFRTISRGKKRFVSILVIVALGVVTFTGLRAACVDLRRSADTFMDEQNLYDIVVQSTLGLTDEDVEVLSALEGVSAAEGGFSETVYLSGDSHEKVLIKMISETGMNAPYLIDGTLPAAANEIAVTQGYLEASGKSIGDTVTIEEIEDDEDEEGENDSSGDATDAGGQDSDETQSDADSGDTGSGEDADEAGGSEDEADSSDASGGSDDSDDDDEVSIEVDIDTSSLEEEDTPTFPNTEFIITAVVTDPADINNPDSGTAFRISSDTDYTFFVTADAVDSDVYTAVYLTVDGAKALNCYSDAYEEAVSAVIDAIEVQIKEEQEETRTQAVTAEAQEKIDDAQDTMNDAFDDVDTQISDAQQELADARAELDDGWAEYYDGLAELEDAKEELTEAEETLTQEEADAKQQIADARAELADAAQELEEGFAELEENEAALSDSQAQIDEARAELEASEEELAEGESELDAAQTQLEETLSELEAQLEQAAAQIDDFPQSEFDALRQAAAAGEDTTSAYNALTQTLEEMFSLDLLQEQIDAMTEQSEALDSQSAELAQTLETMQAQLEETQTQAQQARTQADAAQEEAEQARAQADAAQEEAEQARAQADAAQEEAQNAADDTDSAADADTASDAAEEDTETEALEETAAALEEEAAALEETAAALEEEAAALEETAAALEESAAQLEAQVTELETQAAELETQAAALQAQIAALEDQLDLAKDQIDGIVLLATSMGQVDAGLAEIEAQRSELEEAKAQIAAAWEEIEENQAQLDAASEELSAARSELEEAQQQLEDGEAQLDEQEKTAEEEFADAWETIEESWQEIADAEEELSDGLAELEDGEEAYADGLSQLEDGISTYETERADAEQQLADAQADVDEIEDAVWYVQDRTALSGYANIDSDSGAIEAIGNAFPIVFLAVAILIALTTITRMVEEERGLLGTYKALGFTDGEVLRKYMIFSLSACIAGSILGTIAGFVALPEIIFIIFETMYSLPTFVLSFDLLYGLAGPGIFIVGVCLATWFACRRELKTAPAILMRPKAPQAGSKVILEKIPWIWSRLSFLNKVTARNLFRYKKRLFMTVAGIMGCTALLMCGFAIKDTVSELMPKQYEQVYQYDLLAVADDNDKLLEQMEDSDEITAYLNVRIDTVSVEYGGSSMNVQLVVVPDDMLQTLHSFIALTDTDGNAVLPDDTGILITRNAGQMLGFSDGDTVAVQDLTLTQADVTVTALVQNYLGNSIYMTQSLYETYFGEYEANGAFAFLSEELSDPIAWAQELSHQDGMTSVTATQQLKDEFSTAFVLINMVVYIIISLAAALAFVVLFTLSMTNISERERELATIKVLGFRDHEVHLYVNKETLILTVLGILPGLPLGTVLGHAMTMVLKMPSLYFAVSIYPVSYLYSGGLAVLFALLVQLITNRTLNRINPAEALKSIE